MSKVGPNKASESGLTLIALLVMIILIVILAGVTIRGLTGEDGLLEVAETATEDYAIAEYKEQIEQAVRNSIMKQGLLGGEVELNKIAEDIKTELDIVEKAETENEAKDKGNIIVTVKTKERFQVYYNGAYGVVYVEYIGTEKNGAFPSMTASYNGQEITVETSITGEKITKTELRYKEKIVAEEKEGKQIKYKAETEKTGWYIAKAETEKGNIKYAYIRMSIISDKLIVPNIEITPNTADGQDKWYKQKVTAKITSKNEVGTKICYTLSGAQTKAEAEYTEEINIGESGVTRITAWVQGKDGKESRKVNQVIKVDIDAPEIKDIILTGDKGEKVEGSEYTWIIGTGEIEIKPQIDEVTKKQDKRKWNKWI